MGVKIPYGTGLMQAHQEKSGVHKLVLLASASPSYISDMIRSYNCFPYVSKIPILTK